jgi:hypothetical protein
MTFANQPPYSLDMTSENGVCIDRNSSLGGAKVLAMSYVNPHFPSDRTI